MYLHRLWFMHLIFFMGNGLCFRFKWQRFHALFHSWVVRFFVFLCKHGIVCLIIRNGGQRIMDNRRCFRFDFLCRHAYLFTRRLEGCPRCICPFFCLFFRFHIAGSKRPCRSQKNRSDKDGTQQNNCTIHTKAGAEEEEKPTADQSPAICKILREYLLVNRNNNVMPYGKK